MDLKKLVEKMGHRRWAVFGASLALPVALIFSGCVIPTAATLTPSPTASLAPPIPIVSTSPVVALYNEESMVTLYEQAIPAVVMVRTVVPGEILSPGRFGLGTPESRGQGSGFLIDGEGHILTNNHVVDGASQVTVTLHNGDELTAQVVGSDREGDIALLQVDAAKLGGISPLSLADSDMVKPGQMAIALGSPFGLEGSITVGVVSGLGRSLSSAGERPILDMLQTDAAVNPGNSGGPLLDSQGEVIGINTAVQSASSGIGFAIPINDAKSLLPALLKGGEVSNPWLGISGTEVDATLATALNLGTDHGVYVVSVMAGSPAEKAGLIAATAATTDQGQPGPGGDIITAVDGNPVNEVADILEYFNTRSVGDQVSLSITRGSQSLTLNVTLAEWPQTLPVS